ncbi:hypothetical protein BST96_09515 [Oceanicoccus sagamiensis]|uniref:Uncharacterized protein n=2 Tax=Oceanicoccus sagamiensis TaxID=716816 RepID=A0A1X9NKM8_9GAMM|nr:hypothetical protein BST96_09515 [Oceanicoccus sagamiensis]
MEHAYKALEQGMASKPDLVNLSFGEAFRFKEKNIYEAMIQKLARAQSLVRAAQVLLNNSFLQEQSILHRAIDETNEDIMFLVYAVTNDTITDLHQKFLDAFWEEEIDASGNIIDSDQKRPMVPRKKIRAYLARIEGVGFDQSRGVEVTRTLSKAYSGFVHGASPHIMDLYGGNPAHFHVTGMQGTTRMKEHTDDLWNYMYRTYISHIAVARAFGAEEVVEPLLEHKVRFEKNAGKEY